MWPEQVSNPGPLTYESGALPIALRRPATAQALADLSLHYMFTMCSFFIRVQLFKTWFNEVIAVVKVSWGPPQGRLVLPAVFYPLLITY